MFGLRKLAGIGVPLGERDSAGAVTGRNGGGSLEKAGSRKVGDLGVSEGRDTVAKMFHSPGISARQDRLPYLQPQGHSPLRSKARPSERRLGKDQGPGFPGSSILLLEPERLLVSLTPSKVHARWANANGGREESLRGYLPHRCLSGTNQRKAVSHRCPFLADTQHACPHLQIMPLEEVWKLRKVK